MKNCCQIWKAKIATIVNAACRIYDLSIPEFVYWSISRYIRLWNSLAFILAMDKSGKSPLLLAKAASSENERYKPANGGIGDQETFSKGMVDKGRQVSDIKVLDAEEAIENMTTTVKSVMQWMKESMP